MDKIDLLLKFQNGDSNSGWALIQQFEPLISRNSTVLNGFDEDLHNTIYIKLYERLLKYKIH